ncbi:hypothetical protein FDUTEX481_06820 [Tolypothrix sp. PCC 7601]|nr:hypothetical protein FDUTEX481_06820 [Tolypothrix sp. PCC 7601]
MICSFNRSVIACDSIISAPSEFQGIGDWGLGIGDWGLGIRGNGDWGLRR